MNLQRIESRISRMVTYLESNPNQRMENAVEDCLLPDISDELRQAAYTSLRTQAKIQNLLEYLPSSGQRDVDPNLVDAYNHIDNEITNFVNAGIAASPSSVENIIRPKKNKQGNTHYNQETLTHTLVDSAKRWYREAYKNQVWDGQINTMQAVTDNSTTAPTPKKTATKEAV